MSASIHLPNDNHQVLSLLINPLLKEDLDKCIYMWSYSICLVSCIYWQTFKMQKIWSLTLDFSLLTKIWTEYIYVDLWKTRRHPTFLQKWLLPQCCCIRITNLSFSFFILLKFKLMCMFMTSFFHSGGDIQQVCPYIWILKNLH